MTWNPVCFRLACGSFPSRDHKPVVGYWETKGYGLFAAFKSDWDRFGGMNTEEFRNKWGGEDWEMLDRVLESGLDVERRKLPGMVHFYHTKDTMWENSD